MSEVGGDEVDVQLQGVGPGVLHHLGIADPAAFAGAVEAGDDGDRHRPLGLRRSSPGSFPGRRGSPPPRGSRRAPRRSSPCRSRGRGSSRSRRARICSSKSEGSTAAAAPFSSSLTQRIDPAASAGWRRSPADSSGSSPRYLVVRSTLMQFTSFAVFAWFARRCRRRRRPAVPRRPTARRSASGR